jgi:hypothetical protein
MSKIAYYTCALIKEQRGPGTFILPQFAPTLDMVVGVGNWQFGYCWQNSNLTPSFAMVKVQIPDSITEPQWAAAGVTFLGSTYADALAAAAADSKIGAEVFGPRMSDPSI